MADKKTDDVSKLSFEQALSQLEDIVRKLESGESSLESAITDYTRGTALKTHCEKKLENARLQVEKIVKQADGGIASAPFEPAGQA